MLVRSGFIAALAVSAALLQTTPAWAHVSLASGPGFAAQSQVLTFSVGHGCEGVDTARIEVKIPKELTSVRGVPSVFGDVDIQKDDAGLVTGVVWKNPHVRAADDLFYQLQIRAKIPDAAFSTVYIPVTQVCRTPEGVESTVEWNALPGDTLPAGETEAHPAAVLQVLPVRASGWNQYTVKDKISDLSIFADAQIVWADDAAYSANAATMKLISGETDVKALSEIAAGATIWVKY
jgi:periplasmic copper chaperone A